MATSAAVCFRSSNNCIDAIENGVSRVHILDGRIAHCLLLEIFTNKGIGTAILGEGEENYDGKLKRRLSKRRKRACFTPTTGIRVVLDHGDGVYLYDFDGKKYLNFAAGIAVQALGYHYPGYDEALKAQTTS